MPRSKNGVKLTLPNKNNVEKAVKEVLDGKLLRSAVSIYGVSKSAKGRCENKQRKSGGASDNFYYEPHYDTHRTFNCDEEQKLVNYIKMASHFHYGITLPNLKKIAYDFASKNKNEIP